MARIVPAAADGGPVELTSWTAIGRSPTAEVTVNRKLVSGHHAVVHCSDGAWHLRGLGSRNGTFVDRQRLPTDHERTLTTGQQLTFGDVTFTADDRSLPIARAIRADRAVELEGDRLLAIPSADHPLATLHLAPATMSIRVSRNQDNVFVQVFRPRRQLVRAGYTDGAQIIERRRGSGERRLGVADVRAS